MKKELNPIVVVVIVVVAVAILGFFLYKKTGPKKYSDNPYAMPSDVAEEFARRGMGTTGSSQAAPQTAPTTAPNAGR